MSAQNTTASEPTALPLTTQESALNTANTTGAKTKGDVFTSFTVEDFAVPAGRDEDWIFTPLRRLGGLHDGSFATHSSQGEPSVTLHCGETVIDDGAMPFTCSNTGVTFERVSLDDERLRAQGAPMDRVGAQAFTAASHGYVLTIPAELSIDHPVEIRIAGAGAETTGFAALAILAGHHAHASVVVRTVGAGAVADFRSVRVGEGAHLDLAVLDMMDTVDAPTTTGAAAGSAPIHLANEQMVVGRDAVVRYGYAAFGGAVARTVLHVTYEGPGADAELSGVYFADDGQFFEQRLLVDHSYPHCRSDVLYKGALQGDPASALPETRTAWVGDVLIRPQALNTDTYEKNMNLVLSEGARADAVPNLEIATGEIVGAGHAATVGRFDDEHLFYLMSRGIPEPAARRLIVHGFFSEVINRIPIASVREELEAKVAAELDTVNLDELNEHTHH